LSVAPNTAQAMLAARRPISASGGRSVARTATSASRFDRLSAWLDTTTSSTISG
jgi:hypothetical protein